jgi:hypothetical protein
MGQKQIRIARLMRIGIGGKHIEALVYDTDDNTELIHEFARIVRLTVPFASTEEINNKAKLVSIGAVQNTGDTVMYFEFIGGEYGEV